MDEQEYRDTYKTVNPLRCIYEKSINSRQTGCRHSHRFCLADREGISCQDKNGRQLCQNFLEQLRAKATFTLKLAYIGGPLPHAKEMRVQTGGVLGLQALLESEIADKNPDAKPDINALLDTALSRYQTVESFPYAELMRSVQNYQGRSRGKKPHKQDS